MNAPVFDFGRAALPADAPPHYSFATISVTCTRALLDGLEVGVEFELQGLPAGSARQMRNQIGVDPDFLSYAMYVDAARTRYWGDGTQGSFTITGALHLDDRNRVGTLAFPIYGTVPSGHGMVQPGQWRGAVIARVQYIAQCLGA